MNMPLNLLDFENSTKDAVKAFWTGRLTAHQKQVANGAVDAGQRGAVTAGKNMDGFVTLAADIVRANGLPDAQITLQRRLLCLPGYFRPTKLWDMLVLHDGRLVAALEFKSHVGPSFGNNFNNRCEEALGTAVDLRTAFREGAFGQSPPPFVGWLILAEDATGSRTRVRDLSPHFPLFPDFHNASYLQRYNILCKKLVRESLYSAATVLASPKDAGAVSGDYSEMEELTGLKTFVSGLAAHVAAAAA